MKIIKTISVVFLISHFSLFAGVPVPKISKPSLPYFMEQINFQTILLNVYGNNMSGIIPNQYSDLNWNPAFILGSKENSAYFDFNYQASNSSRYNSSHRKGSRMIYPQWHNSTSISSLQLNPIYNFALIQKINEKITIGIITRSLFDYGPFRSSSNRKHFRNSSRNRYDSKADETLGLTTVEVAENQQFAWGTQTEFTLGYNFSPKIDIGLKFGHYIFRQHGELYDTRYSKHPHSFIDELNDEDFKINGNQYEMGIGLIYHFNDKTNLGVYASFMKGNSSEKNISVDNSYTSSENPTDTSFYSIRKHDIASNYSFSTNGTSPFVSLTFQKELSKNLTFRSFLSYRALNNDITGSINSTDTMFTDMTYNSYSNDLQSYFFTRNETSQRRKDLSDGGGDEVIKNYRWFASLIYKQDNEWSAFAAIMLQIENRETGLYEESIFFDNYNTQRFFFNERTYHKIESYTKSYQYNYNYTKWSAIIPVGIKAHIYNGFSILIGTDLQFDFVDIKKSGNVLYPQRITRITENGEIVVDVFEKNRPETYSSVNPIVFNKKSAIYFGAFYEHASGIKLYVKTEGNIFSNNSWTFGLEYAY